MESTIITGYFSIYKKDKISPKEVISKFLTDDFVFKVRIQDLGDKYKYDIEDFIVCLDGNEFIKLYPKFIEELKPIKRSMTLNIDLCLWH